MRISTAMLHRQGVENMQRQQALLAKTQNQLASGQNMQTAAANPTSWAVAASLDHTMSQMQGFQANSKIAADRLGYEDTALSQASEILARSRELAIQLNSGTLDADQRGIIGNELRQLQHALLDVANTADADGRHIFSGSATQTPPFTISAGAGLYFGDDAVRELDISQGRDIALGDSGADVFQRIPNGNGVYSVTADTTTGTVSLAAAGISDRSLWDGDNYTVSFNAGNYEVRNSANVVVSSGIFDNRTPIAFSGISLSFNGVPADGDQFSIASSADQDMFSTLQSLIDLSAVTADTPAQLAKFQSDYHRALGDLDGAQSHLSARRGIVGARLNVVEQNEAALSANNFYAQEHLSTLRDLDFAEATSRLSLQQTLLQAAQLSYQRVQGLSLFDYLR